MKVQLLISRSGKSGSFKRGDIIDVPDDEAKRMISAHPPHAKKLQQQKKRK